jgi:hypothetical protein
MVILEFLVALLLASMVEVVVEVDVVDVDTLLQVHLVLLDLMVCLVKMELLDNLEMQVVMAQLQLLNHNEIGASIVPQDLPEDPEMLAAKVPMAKLEPQAVLQMVDAVDLLALPDLLDLWEDLVHQDKLVILVKLVLYEMFPAQWDHPVQLELQDNLEDQDLLEIQAVLDPLEIWEHLEMQEPLVSPGNPEQKETTVQMEKAGLEANAITVLHHVLHPVIKPDNLQDSIIPSMESNIPCLSFFLFLLYFSCNNTKKLESIA